jgi:hypothetical protein
MDADLRSRLVAYHNAQPDGPPLAWTPEHVQVRYTEALRVIGKLPIAVMGGSGRSWPSLLVDMAKAFDAEARRVLHGKALDALGIARLDEIEPSVRFASDGPSAEQISRAEEAMQWPMIYLGSYPKGSDALSLYCYGRAFRSFEIAPFLRERLRQAREMAKREADTFNASPEQAKPRAKRQQLARDVAGILKGWLATAEDEAHAAIMRREAIVLLNNWCAEAGCLPARPRAPHLVCPDYVLARDRLDVHRKRAAEIIAKGLRKDRAAVR